MYINRLEDVANVVVVAVVVAVNRPNSLFSPSLIYIYITVVWLLSGLAVVQKLFGCYIKLIYLVDLRMSFYKKKLFSSVHVTVSDT